MMVARHMMIGMVNKYVRFLHNLFIAALQYLLQKEDTDWLTKYIEYEVEGSRPR